MTGEPQDVGPEVVYRAGEQSKLKFGLSRRPHAKGRKRYGPRAPIGWTRFGLAANDAALYTFSFLTLLYIAAFSIVSARERSWFWTTVPSKTLVAALMADAIVGTALTYAGLPGLMPLPVWQTLAIFVYAMVSCLIVNDAVKVMMITSSMSGE